MLQQLTTGELSDMAMMFEQSLQTSLQLYGFISRMIDKRKIVEKEKAALVKQAADTVFVFKGNVYDLSYFWTKSGLPISELQALPLNVSEAVKCNFNMLAQQGYVTLTPDRQNIVLTQSGMDLVNSRDFITNALRERMDVYTIAQKAIAQEQEQRAEQQNLHEEIKLAKAQVKELQQPVYLQNQELCLKISNPNNQSFFSLELFQNDNLKGPILSAPAGAYGSQEAYREIVKTMQENGGEYSLVKYSDKSQIPNVTQINYTDGLMNNTSEIMVESEKTAIAKTVKEGTEQAVSQATQTAVKVGTETAVKTTAATVGGAATAGVSTAAQVAYEVISGGVKLLQDKVIK